METARRQSMGEESIDGFIIEFSNNSILFFPKGIRENTGYARTNVFGVVKELSGRCY